VDDEACRARVFGAVHARVQGIRVRLDDGRVLRARLYASPAALKFGGRFFWPDGAARRGAPRARARRRRRTSRPARRSGRHRRRLHATAVTHVTLLTDYASTTTSSASATP